LGIFSAHHQEFYTVHSALVSFIQVSDDRFQALLYTFWASSLPIIKFSTVHLALVSFMQVSDDRFQAELGSGHQQPA
jgi:Na+-transporting NADH:ubiquinone oxidoreductase subunit NqrE